MFRLDLRCGLRKIIKQGIETFSTVTQGMIPCFRISILCWSNESQATNQEVWNDRFWWPSDLKKGQTFKWCHLEKEDKGNADGSAHAEGLKAGHDGEGAKAEGHDVGDGGDGDGDARMTHCLPDLEDRDVKIS